MYDSILSIMPFLNRLGLVAARADDRPLHPIGGPLGFLGRDPHLEAPAAVLEDEHVLHDGVLVVGGLLEGGHGLVVLHELLPHRPPAPLGLHLGEHAPRAVVLEPPSQKGVAVVGGVEVAVAGAPTGALPQVAVPRVPLQVRRVLRRLRLVDPRGSLPARRRLRPPCPRLVQALVEAHAVPRGEPRAPELVLLQRVGTEGQALLEVHREVPLLVAVGLQGLGELWHERRRALGARLQVHVGERIDEVLRDDLDAVLALPQLEEPVDGPAVVLAGVVVDELLPRRDELPADLAVAHQQRRRGHLAPLPVLREHDVVTVVHVGLEAHGGVLHQHVRVAPPDPLVLPQRHLDGMQPHAPVAHPLDVFRRQLFPDVRAVAVQLGVLPLGVLGEASQLAVPQPQGLAAPRDHAHHPLHRRAHRGGQPERPPRVPAAYHHRPVRLLGPETLHQARRPLLQLLARARCAPACARPAVQRPAGCGSGRLEDSGRDQVPNQESEEGHPRMEPVEPRFY
mmetsp:Transcript_24395/g.76960  ORF Transcript_24395/g.76960 Transcript_24395/m.76960 type:complete len:509 (-) Transcript_24395:199-1725(-)